MNFFVNVASFKDVFSFLDEGEEFSFSLKVFWGLFEELDLFFDLRSDELE